MGRKLKRKWRFKGSLKKMYPYGFKWNVINKPGGEKSGMSGIVKTTSNGLRPQSFARRSVMKVSCSSNIVPSVRH